ncbi:Smr/MutS family protein [Aquabacterium sp.]|uniref:Smr/MutS family protein n=1 Tax=Aquabacterium sp. TaxID=1872578 RepID=UPI0024893D20|nr:Smr/MutS family protein [Aquabacterium sp.]MDI1259247.1 Smr/MutS family protein [Aquabacterium sp.]
MSPARKSSTNTPLSDFADLKRALTKAAKEAAIKLAQEQAERAARAADQRAQDLEQALFKHAVGPVYAMAPNGRAVGSSATRPAPIPKLRQQDEASVLRESLSDEFDVESLLETDDSLSFRRPEVGQDVTRKLRRGVWAVQGHLDLHGLRTDEARERVGAFLREAQTKGWRCVRVVHGKGLGSPGKLPVLKDKVRRWLVQSDRVLAFVQARGDDGGAGALVVLLNSGGKSPAPPKTPKAALKATR